jgi:hypothetical protein
MVLTWPVRTGEEGRVRTLSGGRPRRDVLRLGIAAVLVPVTAPMAACDPFDRDTEPPPPDPLAPLIADALALAAQHEAAVAAHPDLAGRLNPIAAAHRAHATELARVLAVPTGPSGSPTIATSPPADGESRSVLAALRTAEQQGRDRAAQACAQAPATRAALVGSIAAARASHAEALR